MKPSELFQEDDLLLDFAPEDKWQAIHQLVDHLVARGKVPPERQEEVLEAVLARERSVSTGMEHGIALPHAPVDEIPTVLACLGVIRSEEGLEFESTDGQRTRVVVLLVIPRSQKLLHIRTLASVVRVLSRERVREQLLVCEDRAAARAILVAGEQTPA